MKTFSKLHTDFVNKNKQWDINNDSEFVGFYSNIDNYYFFSLHCSPYEMYFK